MSDSFVSHAFVLPDRNFHEWLAALRPYLEKFEGVTALRSPAGNDLNRYRNVSAVQGALDLVAGFGFDSYPPHLSAGRDGGRHRSRNAAAA